MAASIGGIIIDVAADTAKLVEGMTKAQQSVDKNVKLIKSTLGPLAAAFAGVMSVSTIKNIIDTADAIGEQSEKLSLSTEAWSKYVYVAKFAGVELGTLDAAFSAMIRRTNTFTKDGSGAAASAMEELGISVATARKEFTSSEATFDFLIKKLQQMPDGMKKTAVAQDLFSKSATDVIRYANLGADGIERLGKQAEITGNIISSDFASNAGELNDNLDTLETTIAGIGNKLVEKFTPAMIKASQTVSDWLDIQREISASEIKDKIKEITEVLDDLNKNSFTRYVSSSSIEDLNNELQDYQRALDFMDQTEKDIAKNKQVDIDKSNKDKEIEDAIAKEKEKALKIVEAAKKSAEDRKKLEEDFTNTYNETIMTKYDFEMAKLEEQKNNYLKYGQDKAKVEEWFTAKVNELNATNIEEQQKLLDDKLQLEEKFNDDYNQAILSRYDYERLELEKQKEDWIKQGQDKIKIQEMYSAKSKEIAEDEAYFIKRMEEDKREASNSWVFGMEDAVTSYAEMANDNYYQSRMFFENTIDGMADTLTDFVIEGKASFSDFSKSVLSDLARIAVQKQIAGIAGSLFSESGIGTVVSGLFASAHGNVFEGGHDIAFATGGVVGSPTYFPMNNGKTGLMGEAGPEAIMPLSRIGSDLGVKSTPSKVVLNIQNNTSSEISADKISELTRTNQEGEVEKVLSIVLSGVSRNTLGLRDALKGVR
jgi:lambda family phage tail tape measure protein